MYFMATSRLRGLDGGTKTSPKKPVEVTGVVCFTGPTNDVIAPNTCVDVSCD